MVRFYDLWAVGKWKKDEMGEKKRRRKYTMDKKIRIVVSIPVHEKPDVIKDQILNLKKFMENPVIVLHVSNSFYELYDEKEFIDIENVYINPKHMDTKWADIIHTHISNFEYISSQVDFDYFVLHSSNDLYIRKGIEKYMANYHAGFNIRKVVVKDSHWWPGIAAFRDEQLKMIMSECGQNMIIASQIEGSFYKKEIMCEIVKIIKENYNYLIEKENYTREEIYFSTIASSLLDWKEVGKPTTYSEVHYFDRTVWKWRDRTRKWYRYVRWCVSQKMYDRFEMKCNNGMFRMSFYKVNEKIVQDILENKNRCIEKNRYLNDGSGMFELYEGNNIFSVKRVERDYNNRLRKYIRNL